MEFGIQPLLYHDASGAPLYCPYPLSVAIPAMMLGHLTIAGMAEAFVSAGVVAFLQRSDASILQSSAGLVSMTPRARKGTRLGARALRPLWGALAVMLVLTPLGILAAGSAWGEWMASDYSNAAVRRQIAASSFQQAPPSHPPVGLARLSTVWTAPFARYAPPYVRNASFGYMLSSMFGVGLIVLICMAARWMSGYHRGDFFERNIKGLYAAMDRALYAETSAAAGGLLQGIDPRVKVAGLFALIAASALASRLWTIAAILAVATVLAALSLISLRTLASRVWLGAFAVQRRDLDSGALPDAGRRSPALSKSRHGNYLAGLRTASFLVLRVEASTTLALLLIFTTPWMHVLKALRIFRAPVLLVVILGMTCRYILLLLETAHEMFESRKSRTVGTLARSERRRMAVSAAGVLLNRTFQLSGDVYLAMQSRGFRGEVYLLDDFQMRQRDWVALAGFASLTVAAIWAGWQ